LVGYGALGIIGLATIVVPWRLTEKKIDNSKPPSDYLKRKKQYLHVYPGRYIIKVTSFEPDMTDFRKRFIGKVITLPIVVRSNGQYALNYAFEYDTKKWRLWLKTYFQE
jgi:hypothetical protein